MNRLNQITEDIVNSNDIIRLQVLTRIILSNTMKQYNKGLLDAEVRFNMNFLPNDEKIDFLKNFIIKNINGLNENVKDMLRKEISIGLMNLETPEQLKKRVMKVTNFGRERAELISRTESVRAYNQAYFQAAKESGLKLKKQWSSQPEKDDNNPCPLCEPLNNEIKELNDVFTAKNGESVLLPPLHPRCKCRVIYVQEPKKSMIMESLGNNKVRIVYDNV